MVDHEKYEHPRSRIERRGICGPCGKFGKHPEPNRTFHSTSVIIQGNTVLDGSRRKNKSMNFFGMRTVSHLPKFYGQINDKPVQEIDPLQDGPQPPAAASVPTLKAGGGPPRRRQQHPRDRQGSPVVPDQQASGPSGAAFRDVPRRRPVSDLGAAIFQPGRQVVQCPGSARRPGERRTFRTAGMLTAVRRYHPGASGAASARRWTTESLNHRPAG